MAEQIVQNVQQIKEPNNATDDQNQDALLKIKLLADSGYSSGKNLSDIQQNKKLENIDPYIPDKEYQAKLRGKNTKEDLPFSKSKFVFDEHNKLLCPEGKELNFSGTRTRRNGEVERVYQCPGSICRSCKHFGICTPNKNGRSIQISENELLVHKMRKKLSTPEGKQIYSKRMITVEPVFGNLSQNLGFREFLLRGLEKIKGEFSLMCSAHNLLKIARFLREQKMLLTQALAKPCPVAIPDG